MVSTYSSCTKKHRSSIFISLIVRLSIGADADISCYVCSLPACARPHLEWRLDWGHEGVDQDLHEIAHHMLDWEEALMAHLQLTEVDRSDIKDTYPGKPFYRGMLKH